MSDQPEKKEEQPPQKRSNAPSDIEVPSFGSFVNNTTGASQFSFTPSNGKGYPAAPVSSNPPTPATPAPAPTTNVALTSTSTDAPPPAKKRFAPTLASSVVTDHNDNVVPPRSPRTPSALRRPDAPTTANSAGLDSGDGRRNEDAAARHAREIEERNEREQDYYDKIEKAQADADASEKKAKQAENDLRTLKSTQQDLEVENQELKDKLDKERKKGGSGKEGAGDSSNASRDELEITIAQLKRQLAVSTSENADQLKEFKIRETDHESTQAMVDTLHAELDDAEEKIEQLQQDVAQNAQAKADLDLINAEFEQIWSELPKGLGPSEYLQHAREQKQRQSLRRDDSQTSLQSQHGSLQGLRPRGSGRHVSGQSIQDELKGADESDGELGDDTDSKSAAGRALLDLVGDGSDEDAEYEEDGEMGGADEPTLTTSDFKSSKEPATASQPAKPQAHRPGMSGYVDGEHVKDMGPAGDGLFVEEEDMRHKMTQTPASNLTEDRVTIPTPASQKDRDLSKLQSEQAQLVEENTKLKADLKKTQGELNDRTRSLQDREKGIATGHENIKGLKTEIAGLQAKIAGLGSQAPQEVQDPNLKELKDEIVKLKDDLKKAQNELRSVQSSRDDQDQKASQGIKTLEDENTQLKEELEKTKSELLGSQGPQDVKALEAEIVPRKDELKKTQDELKKTQDELKKTQDELKKTQDELKKTQDELKKTQDELKKTQDELKKTQDELKKTQDELKKTQDELKKTQDELKKTQDELEKTKKDLAETTKTLNYTRLNKDDSEQRNKSLQTKLDKQAEIARTAAGTLSFAPIMTIDIPPSAPEPPPAPPAPIIRYVDRVEIVTVPNYTTEMPVWLQILLAIFAAMCLTAIYSARSERNLWLAANSNTHAHLLRLTSGRDARAWFELYVLQFEEWLGIDRKLMG